MIHDYTTCPGCVIKDSQIDGLRNEVGVWKRRYDILLHKALEMDIEEIEKYAEMDIDRNEYPQDRTRYPPSGYD